MLEKLEKILSAPISNATIVLIRVFCGLMFFVECIRYFYADWIRSYWMEPDYFFHYQFFEWLSPLPGNGMYYLFGVLSLASLGICFGLLYRLSSWVFFLGFSYTFLLDKSLYLNHFYLYILLAFLLCIIPANRRFALDCYIFKKKSNRMPRWHLLIFQWQVGFVYFFGALAKINPDWLRGEPMRSYLAGRIQNPKILAYIDHDMMGWITSYGGIMIDLFALPALLYKRTRIPACFVLLVFHFINQRIFHIGLFPFVMGGLLLIYFPSHQWDFLFPRVRESVEKFSWKLKNSQVLFLSAFMSFHILMPLRHLIYEGPVIWNEEGLRFAWHMKLRGKTGFAKFLVRYENGREELIDPADELLRYQHHHMSYQPDMILEYAHHLRDQKRQESQQNVAIYAQVSCALNGRDPQVFVDPTVDLAKESFQVFRAYHWVLPLETPLHKEK